MMSDEQATGRPREPLSVRGRSKPPGLKEIAAYLNLSPATVSMVINDVPLAKSLSEETRARVLAAAKEFNYRPNLLARALSKRESRTIGVISSESSDGYFTRVMRGIEEALLEAGYLHFITSHLGRPELVREYPAALTQRGVDGLIFMNTCMHEHPGVPAVSVSAKSTMDGVTSILVNQREGMLHAVEHLVGLGHRRILTIRGSNWSLDADDRYGAIAAAADSLGVGMPQELTLTLEANQLSPELAFRTMQRRLQRGVDFTAVLAFNDVAALGAIRAMEDVGLHCPADISVLGVDDVSTAAYGVPRLTTSAQPLEAMGAAAAKSLLGKIRNPEANDSPEVMFPMTLQVRESTAPAASTGRGAAGLVRR